MNIRRVLAEAAVVAAFTGAALFVGLYALTSWWRSELGWTLMVMVVCEVVIFGVPVASLVFGPARWQGWVTLAGLVLFAVFSLWRVVVLARVVFRRKPDDSKELDRA